MKFILIAAAAALVTPTPSFAQTDEVSKDTIICKRERGPELGSNIRARDRKTCMLASEWRELFLNNERAKLKIQDRTRGGIPPRAPSVGGGN